MTAMRSGQSATKASVIPVRRTTLQGISRPGFTRAVESPVIFPPLTLTAASSVMRCWGGRPPVVSMSTTANVVWGRKRPERQASGMRQAPASSLLARGLAASKGSRMAQEWRSLRPSALRRSSASAE